MQEKQYQQLCCELMNRRLCGVWTLDGILKQYIEPHSKCCDTPNIQNDIKTTALLHNINTDWDKQEYVSVCFTKCNNCWKYLESYIM